MTNETDLLARARAAMPGGVSSPVRAFGAVEGDPPFVARGAGCRVWDADGKEYIDLVGSWGPLILGHAHPAVVEAVTKAVHDGLTFGATCEGEVELAERILRCFPFAERVRFTSSGTEATMSAVRLARGATGRDRVLKFEGCYHGHVDHLLVKGGSGLATFGTPSSAGVPKAFTELTDVLPLDDDAALRALFAEKGTQLACVIVEPMPANAGLLVQRQAWLELLRELCTASGALLIFDEVISGFRVARGGMTERSGITPDLVAVGKIIGGGMPVGAFLGKAALMEKLAPLGPVYHAGTLSGNPVAMAAGIATLDTLLAEGTYERLDALGARLEAGWRDALAAAGVEADVARVGSVLWVSLQSGPAPRAFHLVKPEGAELYAKLHRRVLDAGVWMAPSAYEVAFVSLAHDEAAVDACIDAFSSGLDAVASGSHAGVSANDIVADGRRQARIYVGIVGLYVVLLTWWIIYFSNQGDLLVQRILRGGTTLTPEQAEAVRRAAHESLRMFIFEGAFLGLLLLGSVWFVVRAMRREIMLHRQQSNFVSAVTHELRSPIASAQLYLDSIMMGRTDEARSARYLRHAREDMERLSAMVEQILLVRRIARTGVMLAPEPADLARLVTHWADRQDALRERGVELRVHAVSPVPASVDPELFEKVVDNLVSNAVKYGAEQPVDVAVEIEEGTAVVSVRDHGPGLQGADPRRLRQAFVRGGDEDVRTRPGVGLGLYIVGQIVEAHGGRFDLADAHDGPGAVARVEVPLVDASLLAGNGHDDDAGRADEPAHGSGAEATHADETGRAARSVPTSPAKEDVR